MTLLVHEVETVSEQQVTMVLILADIDQSQSEFTNSWRVVSLPLYCKWRRESDEI